MGMHPVLPGLHSVGNVDSICIAGVRLSRCWFGFHVFCTYLGRNESRWETVRPRRPQSRDGPIRAVRRSSRSQRVGFRQNQAEPGPAWPRPGLGQVCRRQFGRFGRFGTGLGSVSTFATNPCLRTTARGPLLASSGFLVGPTTVTLSAGLHSVGSDDPGRGWVRFVSQEVRSGRSVPYLRDCHTGSVRSVTRQPPD